MTNQTHFFSPGRNRGELVVVLQGFGGDSVRMASVCDAVRLGKPDADIYAPTLGYGGLRWKVCLRKAELVVVDLISDIERIIDERASAGSGYQSITLVGHSFGAVMARKVAVVGFGEQRSDTGERLAPFELEFASFRRPRPWAPLIRRLVLLAGMNRGWAVSSAMDWVTTVWWGVLQFVGETVFRGKPTIFALRKGAPFLVQTRLQWLALMNPEFGARPHLMAVQLLGTKDDQVSPDDNVDFSVDLFGEDEEKSFCYIEVGQSGHGDVIQMGVSGPQRTKGARDERREKFLFALTASPQQLAMSRIRREHMQDTLPPPPDFDVTDVVFVMHGIRDKGFWTSKIARKIKEHAASQRKIESWTESYGYFAMLPFLFRSVRQRKVEWMMDRYAEARARFPKASFHYVGHSNGTYLAAQALQEYPAARFKRIVFAGSVVRRDYDWNSLTDRDPAAPEDMPRVERVLNYVATRDWVVAIFPKGVQPWKRFNLGSAGHDGFDQARPEGPVHEVKYIIGSHGAGHEEPNWNHIARFVVSGDVPKQDDPPFGRQQNWLLCKLANASFVIFPLIAALVLGIGLWLLWLMLTPLVCSLVPALQSWGVCDAMPNGQQIQGRTIAFFAYVWTIYLVVTRF